MDRNAPVHVRPSRPHRRQPRPQWHLILTCTLVVAAVAVLVVQLWHEHRLRLAAAASTVVALPPPPPPPVPDASAETLAEALRKQVPGCLAELGVDPNMITIGRSAEGTDLISVRLPEDVPLMLTNYHLTRLVQAAGGQVIRAEDTQQRRRLELAVGVDSVVSGRIVCERVADLSRRTGLIAIVIDRSTSRRLDPAHDAALCALPAAVAFSVSPADRQLEGFLAAAGQAGHPILMTLPVVPGDDDPGRDAIAAGQDEARIRQRLAAALARVPAAAGCTNLARSRATADARVMEIVFAVLRDRRLRYLDSRLSTSSIGCAAAGVAGVTCVQGDLLLDAVDEQPAVEAQLFALAAAAGRTGTAVGVGRDRENTILALRATLPRLETRGHRLVPVTQLAPSQPTW